MRSTEFQPLQHKRVASYTTICTADSTKQRRPRDGTPCATGGSSPKQTVTGHCLQPAIGQCTPKAFLLQTTSILLSLLPFKAFVHHHSMPQAEFVGFPTTCIFCGDPCYDKSNAYVIMRLLIREALGSKRYTLR